MHNKNNKLDNKNNKLDNKKNKLHNKNNKLHNKNNKLDNKNNKLHNKNNKLHNKNNKLHNKKNKLDNKRNNNKKTKLDNKNKINGNNKILNKLIKTNKNTNKTRKGLTKKNVCKKISHHFMVRANLISAIASTVSEKRYEGFCNQRINSLENGEICLPMNYDFVQTLPMIKASNILSRYINNFNYSSCKESSGYYKKATREQKKKIMQPDTELQERYILHVQKMKNNYLKKLSLLKKILIELTENSKLTNSELKILCEKTKEVLDEMYIECQKDYILGVISLLHIDYQLPKITKNSMNNIKDALKESIENN